MSVQIRHSQFSPTTIIGAAVAWPIRTALAGIEWVLVEVVARIGSLPFVLLIAIVAHIQVAWIRAGARAEEARAQQMGRILAATITAQTEPFRQALAEIEHLDAQHAQLDPQFAQSLATAQLIFDRGIVHVEAVLSSDEFRAKLLDAIQDT